MREIPADKIFVYAAAVSITAVLTPFMSKFKRTRGKSVAAHGVFLVSAALMLTFIPEGVQDDLFSPGGVILIGSVVPIYESVVAVCSIDSADDLAWLQFWLASGSFSFATEFMDEIIAHLPEAGEHWYEFEFFLTAWFMLPFTDGSGLLYDLITKPFIAPVATTLKVRMEGYVHILLTMVNTAYLWIMWFAFLQLEEEQRRFVTVFLGTFYPMAATVVVVSTANQDPSSIQEQNFWLTYWSTYTILFILMDYLENFIGHIPGFYSLCAVTTLYLFLPMFKGADVVFRRVLVPLSGQYENMLLHDAFMVKLGMENVIPAKHHERVMSRAADLFLKKGS
mmetsp:Transcript_18776/g.24184  ORF Transcript_18776/g.24184 Transcript_18776/m.24184 type:complete len:337 (-) Transcript_18776:197-1207(-)|eukprot:CAMPEP_0198149420 /NCGR_PEP_ID=MMETSP1443-20131203/46478_1 /TAXON_ID=186043 /ORGANISM="Entomoneis sp., Strain CCMP2396" /LENGTH=336 /DNA_ID=CAMNT_0043814445 /DNA_START=40 /DNA_END=1050 /DNA_ORIENTATION=+